MVKQMTPVCSGKFQHFKTLSGFIAHPVQGSHGPKPQPCGNGLGPAASTPLGPLGPAKIDPPNTYVTIWGIPQPHIYTL